MGLFIADLEDVLLKPGYCLIEPAEPPDHSGLILLPDKARPQTTYGFVVRLGPPKPEGHDPGFKEGDWVVYERYKGEDWFTDDRVDITYMRQEDVSCVFARE